MCFNWSSRQIILFWGRKHVFLSLWCTVVKWPCTNVIQNINEYRFLLKILWYNYLTKVFTWNVLAKYTKNDRTIFLYWFTFFVFSRNYFYLVGRSTLWSFLQRLVYTLVVTGFVQIEICLNVYVDTGTSHKYVTLCLCAPKRKRKRVLGRKREKLLWYERTVLERRLHCKFNSGFKLSLLRKCLYCC